MQGFFMIFIRPGIDQVPPPGGINRRIGAPRVF
jgi:hypothetical protein